MENIQTLSLGGRLMVLAGVDKDGVEQWREPTENEIEGLFFTFNDVDPYPGNSTGFRIEL